MFYDRNYDNDSAGGDAAFGGAATEIRIYPAGTIAAQTGPNQ
jgi:hypothetical protein